MYALGTYINKSIFEKILSGIEKVFNFQFPIKLIPKMIYYYVPLGTY